MALKEKLPEYVGWYQPTRRVVWTGEKINLKTGELVKEPSRTKQSHKAECDVNNIVKAFMATGDATRLMDNTKAGVYADLPAPFEYQDALNLVIQAEASFASLPSGLRNRFDNDPGAFLAFATDPANQAELIKLGLATDTRPPPPPPPPAPLAAAASAEPPKKPTSTSTGGDGG